MTAEYEGDETQRGILRVHAICGPAVFDDLGLVHGLVAGLGALGRCPGRSTGYPHNHRSTGFRPSNEASMGLPMGPDTIRRAIHSCALLVQALSMIASIGHCLARTAYMSSLATFMLPVRYPSGSIDTRSKPISLNLRSIASVFSGKASRSTSSARTSTRAMGPW